MAPLDPKTRSAGLLVLALAAVYLVWGSTYLAIRFAIETLPAFTMAGVRFVVAGGLLYAWGRLRGGAAPERAHWRPAALIGGLLLLGGNGGVVWAEHRIPSGVAALLVAVEPVWIALLTPLVLVGARRAGLRVAIGLAAGLAGVGTLVIDPTGGVDPSSVDLWGALAVVLASLSWALGSLLSVRARLPASPWIATGMQMLAGGTLLLAAGAASGEWATVDFAAFSARSLGALAYLVVFGSIVAFTAYAYLLRNARPAVAATYAFVNPVVAVLLGWLFAAEPLTWRVGVASLLILVAVALIFSEKETHGAAAAEPRASRRGRRAPAPPAGETLAERRTA
jgi:drug/metabolite transporter (DMT)-like permease